MASYQPTLAAVRGYPPGAAPSRIEQIRGKALELFATRGFAQVGMRELALHIGITAGSLYHHFVSKEQLLFELFEEFYEDLHELVVLNAVGSPMQRLRALLQVHIALHERCHLQMRVVEQEFRCLSLAHQQQIVQLRSHYEEQLLQCLQAAGAVAPRALLQVAVHGLLAWLNNVPCSSLDSEQRQALLTRMAMGALSALLRQADDAAPMVPLHTAYGRPN